MSLKDNCLAYLLAAITVAFTIFQLHTFRINGDIAWLCHEVREMINGKVIYKDIIENNPPLILLLYYPLVAASMKFVLYAGSVVQYFALALSIISAHLSSRLLMQNKDFSQFYPGTFLLFLATMLLIPNADGDFGQREHLMVILTLPYLILCLPSSDRPATKKSIAIGLAAGIGFCLKPYFIIIFAAAVISRNLLKQRKFHTLHAEDITIIATGILYVIATAIFFPEYLAILPFISKTYPHYYFIPTLTIARLAYPFYAILIAAYLSRPLANHNLKFLLFILIASTLEAAIQFKPWSYITLPAFTYVAILLGFSAFLLKQSRANNIGLSILLCLLFFSLPVGSHNIQSSYKKQDALKSELVLLKEAGAKSIHIFSESFGFNFPTIFDAGYIWSSRYAHEWMFRGIYGDAKSNPGFKPLPGMEEYSDKLYADFKEDFAISPPDILMFDVTQNSPDFPLHYDYKSWIEKDKVLGGMLTGFRFYKTLNLCDPEKKSYIAICRFDIYVRRGISTP